MHALGNNHLLWAPRVEEEASKGSNNEEGGRHDVETKPLRRDFETTTTRLLLIHSTHSVFELFFEGAVPVLLGTNA